MHTGRWTGLGGIGRLEAHASSGIALVQSGVETKTCAYYYYYYYYDYYYYYYYYYYMHPMHGAACFGFDTRRGTLQAE